MKIWWHISLSNWETLTVRRRRHYTDRLQTMDWLYFKSTQPSASVIHRFIQDVPEGWDPRLLTFFMLSPCHCAAAEEETYRLQILSSLFGHTWWMIHCSPWCIYTRNVLVFIYHFANGGQSVEHTKNVLVDATADFAAFHGKTMTHDRLFFHIMRFPHFSSNKN